MERGRPNLLQEYANPVILLAAHIKVPAAVANIANLLVLVQMLLEEASDLGLVNVAHAVGRDEDFVTVAVAALMSQRVHILNRGQVPVDHPDGLEVVGSDGLA